MTIKIIYRETSEFQRDLKFLQKKFRSLTDDLEFAKIATIEPYHEGLEYINSIFLIPNFCTDKIKICKLKKFACKSLKGRGAKSGIRIIYAFYPATTTVEFIEIYFKGESENESKQRIKDYLGAN